MAGVALKLVVATDIFGHTAELDSWCKPLLQLTDLTLEVLTPYPKELLAARLHGEPSAAADTRAYQLFLQHGGMQAYVEKLHQHLQSTTDHYIAVGFSAGAAAMWQLAAQLQPCMQQLFCFYGGQIRSCAQLQPKVKTTLIWAEEPQFDVGKIHQAMLDRNNIRSYLTPYRHGFINPHSAGYQREAASFYQHWLLDQLLGKE